MDKSVQCNEPHDACAVSNTFQPSETLEVCFAKNNIISPTFLLFLQQLENCNSITLDDCNQLFQSIIISESESKLVEMLTRRQRDSED